ncbi:hypothetical protein Vretimale_9941, partial [Volvox reticuliferus]
EDSELQSAFLASCITLARTSLDIQSPSSAAYGTRGFTYPSSSPYSDRAYDVADEREVMVETLDAYGGPVPDKWLPVRGGAAGRAAERSGGATQMTHGSLMGVRMGSPMPSPMRARPTARRLVTACSAPLNPSLQRPYPPPPPPCRPHRGLVTNQPQADGTKQKQHQQEQQYRQQQARAGPIGPFTRDGLSVVPGWPNGRPPPLPPPPSSPPAPPSAWRPGSQAGREAGGGGGVERPQRKQQHYQEQQYQPPVLQPPQPPLPYSRQEQRNARRPLCSRSQAGSHPETCWLPQNVVNPEDEGSSRGIEPVRQSSLSYRHGSQTVRRADDPEPVLVGQLDSSTHGLHQRHQQYQQQEPQHYQHKALRACLDAAAGSSSGVSTAWLEQQRQLAVEEAGSSRDAGGGGGTTVRTRSRSRHGHRPERGLELEASRSAVDAWLDQQR